MSSLILKCRADRSTGRRGLFVISVRMALCALLAFALTPVSSAAQGKEKPGKEKPGLPAKKDGKADHNKKGGKNAKGGGKGDHGKGGGEASVFKPEVLRKILQDNPALPKNFITQCPPGQPIKLGNGKTYPMHQLTQFLQANFRLEWYARKKEGQEIVSMMAERLRKLFALPDFYERVKHHRKEYRISPKGKVSSEEAYRFLRHCNRRIGVTAGKQYKAPVGGGSGIAAPSWAVWKAMNIFEHETCHCIGIGHNSGGLSGAIAGTLRDWDRKKKWNYPTIDANTLTVTPAMKHAKASDAKVPGNKGKRKGKGKPS